MPLVSIPEKEMIVRFPDDMPPEDVERAIYSQVYGRPVLSQAEPPTVTEKLTRFVSDLFEDEDPGLGPLTEEDREAFEPAGELTVNLKKYASYAPYLAVKALHGAVSPFLVPKKRGAPGDLDTTLRAATEYWRKEIGESVEIPNVGIGFDEKGELRIEPREPIRFADILGATAEAGGAVAGPVRAAIGAGGLITQKLATHARPFYRSIVRGMIGGSLLGESEKDKTLENMALFGTFEPVAYAIGKLSEILKTIKDSTTWFFLYYGLPPRVEDYGTRWDPRGTPMWGGPPSISGRGLLRVFRDHRTSGRARSGAQNMLHQGKGMTVVPKTTRPGVVVGAID